MTLENMDVDFDSSFEKGHVYVGLSRAKSLNSIRIRNLTEDMIKADPKYLYK